MEWVETTGRTVAEALDEALDELGVDEDEVEYEIIAEPRSGLLGRREARIRARVKPLSREKPGERRRREPRRRGEARPGRGVAVTETSRAAAGRPRGGSRTRRRSRGGRPAGNGEGQTRMREERAVSETEVPLEEQAAAAEDFTRGLVDAFGADATVETRIEDEGVLVDVTGTDLGLLVGQKGATLQAIEELVRTVVQRQTEGQGARIRVDVAGYRAKRREALEQFVHELAERVRDTGRDQALEPMSASDRKVVHDAIAPLDGVTTVSEGEEPRRRVVLRRG